MVADAQALLNSGSLSSGGALPALPASTSFVVTDRQGQTVACALSMNNLFGTGRIAGSTGIVLGASPAQRPLPLLAAGIVHQARISARLLRPRGRMWRLIQRPLPCRQRLQACVRR